MSATQQTKNLKLPYYTESDFTSWADFNTAMDIIDTTYGTTNTDVDTLTANVQNNTNAIADNTKNIGNLNMEMQLQQNTTAALQSTINNQQSNITTLNAGLSAAQNDITSLQSSIGNIPPDLSKEIEAIKNKNKEQDTAIATAQSEANTATEAAQAAANKISLLPLNSVFENSGTMTINNNSYDVTFALAGSSLTLNDISAITTLHGYIVITGLPDSLRVTSPNITITLKTKTGMLATQIEQGVTINLVLASTLNNYPATLSTPPNKDQCSINFYIEQGVSGATIQNVRVYF